MPKDMRGACYKCEYRGDISGEAHFYCKNRKANVIGHERGETKGWFDWPYNFDPVWLVKCDGFERKR